MRRIIIDLSICILFSLTLFSCDKEYLEQWAKQMDKKYYIEATVDGVKYRSHISSKEGGIKINNHSKIYYFETSKDNICFTLYRDLICESENSDLESLSMFLFIGLSLDELHEGVTLDFELGDENFSVKKMFYFRGYLYYPPTFDGEKRVQQYDVYIIKSGKMTIKEVGREKDTRIISADYYLTVASEINGEESNIEGTLRWNFPKEINEESAKSNLRSNGIDLDEW